jgi:hypothetical protein
MSATECKRCDGNGTLARFSHVAGGRCFACGRSAVRDDGEQGNYTPTRQQSIARLFALVTQAKAHPEHFAPMRGACGDMEPAPQFEEAQRALRVAPADVRDRAIAAFSRIGIAL